jgi:dipeptidyl aminopeptidase/acylaminoacyl peptidase
MGNPAYRPGAGHRLENPLRQDGMSSSDHPARYLLPPLLALAVLLGSLTAAPGCVLDRSGNPAPLVPMSVFFMSQDRFQYRISPDGRHIAYMARWEGKTNLFVQPVGADSARRVTSGTERDIVYHGWAGSERLVYMQDVAGEEDYHLFSVRVDGSDEKELTPFPGARAIWIDMPRTWGTELLIGLNRRDPALFDIYRLDAETGDLTLLDENPGDHIDWFPDNTGRLRLAFRSAGESVVMLYRDSEEEPFRPVAELGLTEACTPLSFTFDNRNLYVLAHAGHDKQGLHIFDPAVGRFLECIYEHPEVDLSEVQLSSHRRILEGVSFLRDRRDHHFFDPARQAQQEELERRIREPVVDIVSRCDDESRLVLFAYGDKTMGSFYYYEPAAGRLAKLADVSPWLAGERLADMQPIRLTARDGLPLTGYLTLPVGVEAHDLPAIVLVHHGHDNRVVWRYDPVTQFLANRGYAVLQLNYRGSAGFGAAFAAAAHRQWGRAMQDDLSDGVAWLVDQGIADPQRIGIMGQSYGGYAALAGLAFTPELYACGVCFAGIPDPVAFLGMLPPYAGFLQARFRHEIGDPLVDREYLEQVSPLRHADRIVDPLLVVHGANDTWADVAMTDSLVAVLQALDRDVRYLRVKGEGHNFISMRSMYAYYRDLEEFFGECLGGRVERLPQ